MTTPISIRSKNQSVVLIGVGNPVRHDDGIGPALLTALEPEFLADVTLMTVTDDPTTLLEAWADADLAVVVDAAVCRPSTPGRIHRYTSNLSADSPVAGNSHGLGMSDAIRLATVLNRAPRRPRGPCCRGCGHVGGLRPVATGDGGNPDARRGSTARSRCVRFGHAERFARYEGTEDPYRTGTDGRILNV